MKPIGKHYRSKIGFADLYLERYGSGSVQGLPEPDPDLGLIVTIPSYKEPDLAASINSLLNCEPPGINWEVIININYPQDSNRDTIETSRASLEAAQQINHGLKRDDVRIHCLWNPDMPARHAGVGLARKIAMDQAVQRFNSIGCQDGIILSFDADSSCEKNYLSTIVDFYRRHSNARTANIYFDHPLEGPFEPRIYRSIAQYELYLRYMRLATELAGHPHAIHTVGSSFSVRARTYIRVNGMGRDKAGEDFYFLHKCINLKNFWEINSTMVCPSVRESDRVTFGTGASINKQMQGEEDLFVYDLNSFTPLKDLFERVGCFWKQLSENSKLDDDWERCSAGLNDFLKSHNATLRIQEMFENSAGENTFVDKFYAWFNGFLVLRYLNESHKKYYLKAPVIGEANKLAEILGIKTASTAEELLVLFRNYEKGRGTRKII